MEERSRKSNNKLKVKVKDKVGFARSVEKYL
jgi:hypothetical protein